MAIFENYCIESNHILHSCKYHRMPFTGGPETRIKNPRWRTGDMLQRWANCYYVSRSSSDFEEIGHDDAQLYRFDRSDCYKFEILKIEHGGGRHLENIRSSHMWIAV